jgi:hypothetical protein
MSAVWRVCIRLRKLSQPSKKASPNYPCKLLISCGVFVYAGGINKTLAFLELSLHRTKSTVAADALRFFSF